MENFMDTHFKSEWTKYCALLFSYESKFLEIYQDHAYEL